MAKYRRSLMENASPELVAKGHQTYETSMTFIGDMFRENPELVPVVMAAIDGPEAFRSQIASSPDCLVQFFVEMVKATCLAIGNRDRETHSN